MKAVAGFATTEFKHYLPSEVQSFDVDELQQGHSTCTRTKKYLTNAQKLASSQLTLMHMAKTDKKAQLTQGLRAPSAAILDIMEPEIAPFDPPINYTVTLKLGFWVTQGHRKRHYSIEHIQLYIRLP